MHKTKNYEKVYNFINYVSIFLAQSVALEKQISIFKCYRRCQHDRYLNKKYGATDSTRIRKGVEQVAMLWYSDDGTKDDFKEFCKYSFIPSGEELDQALRN